MATAATPTGEAAVTLTRRQRRYRNACNCPLIICSALFAATESLRPARVTRCASAFSRIGCVILTANTSFARNSVTAADVGMSAMPRPDFTNSFRMANEVAVTPGFKFAKRPCAA